MPSYDAPPPDRRPQGFPLVPALRARLMGLLLLAAGVLLLVSTVLVIVLQASLHVLTVVLVLVILLIAAGAFLLSPRRYAVELDEDGYRIRYVRGAGTRAGRWEDVEDLTTAQVAGSRCALLRLRGERSTVIPVDAIAGDPEDLVRELGRRLSAWQRRRRVG